MNSRQRSESSNRHPALLIHPRDYSIDEQDCVK